MHTICAVQLYTMLQKVLRSYRIMHYYLMFDLSSDLTCSCFIEPGQNRKIHAQPQRNTIICPKVTGDILFSLHQADFFTVPCSNTWSLSALSALTGKLDLSIKSLARKIYKKKQSGMQHNFKSSKPSTNACFLTLHSRSIKWTPCFFFFYRLFVLPDILILQKSIRWFMLMANFVNIQICQPSTIVKPQALLSITLLLQSKLSLNKWF